MNVEVRFLAPEGAEEEAHEKIPESDLNPIFPELKEITWGFGSFLVLVVLMRCFLYRAATRHRRAQRAHPSRSRAGRADHR